MRDREVSKGRLPGLSVDWKRWLSALAGWSPAIALVTAILFAPAILTRVGQPGLAGGIGRAEGYTRLINSLVVPRGWLGASCDAEGECRVGESALAPRGRIWSLFRARTYLEEDLRRPGVWRVAAEHGAVDLLGIDPTAHQVSGPYTTSGVWNGALLYRATASDALVAADAETFGRLEFTSAAPSAHGRVSRAEIFSGKSPLESAGPAIRHDIFSASCPGQLIASVMRVGSETNDAIVRVLHQECVAVRIGGRAQRVTRQGGSYVKLRRGESIAFRDVASNRELRLIYQRLRSPFSYLAGDAEDRRTTPGLDAFATGAGSLLTSQGWTGDFVTTLDQPVHQNAQTQLDALRLAPLTRAAVTVMDARTGELLALASRPGPAYAEARSVQIEGLTNHNQNLVGLPIGSVAKVPIGLAITDTFPDLLQLRVMPGGGRGGFRTLLGVDLGPSDDNPEISFRDTVSSPAPIGLIDAIAKSSNKYATALMLLGLRQPGAATGPALAPAGDCYFLEEVEHCAPPIDRLLVAGPAGAFGYPLASGGGLRTPLWGSRLMAWFDVCYEYIDLECLRGEGDPLWGLSPPAWTDGGRFGVYPERENLGLDNFPSLRNDYLMSILGGGRSRWTNVKVAEAFSRIVTLERVHARLSREFEPKAFVTIEPAHTQAWSTMLTAMEAVARSGTAASSLGGVAAGYPSGFDYHVFAKTGTPTTMTQSAGRAAAAEAIIRLTRRGCGVYWDPEHQRIRLELSQRQACADIVRQGSGAARLERVLPGLSASYARDTPDLARRPHRIERLSLPDNLREARGHVIAVVVGQYALGADPRTNRPLKALTIVVNIQDRGANERMAAQLARDVLLDDSVIRWWSRPPEQGT